MVGGDGAGEEVVEGPAEEVGAALDDGAGTAGGEAFVLLVVVGGVEGQAGGRREARRGMVQIGRAHV